MWPFSSKKKPETKGPAAPVVRPKPPVNGAPPAAATLLGKDISIKGDLVADHDVTLLGYQKGKVKGRKVELGISAKVVGDVEAAEVVCSGNLQGKVEAKGKVFVGPQGKVQGGIKAGQLSVDSKAVLGGRFDVGGA